MYLGMLFCFFVNIYHIYLNFLSILRFYLDGDYYLLRDQVQELDHQSSKGLYRLFLN